MRVFRIMVSLATALALVACGRASAGEETAKQRGSDDRPAVAGIYELQADIHRSGTSKDVDLLMSRWADDASLVVKDVTYVGKEQIRNFFVNSHPAFKPENRWVALTRSPNIRVTANGNHGTLYFECYFVDATTKQVVAATSASTKVVRVSGRWLLTEYRSGSVELEP